MKGSRHNRRSAIIASALMGLGMLVVPTLGVSSCASVQKNPDARPGLRRRANESHRDLDRNIEMKRKSEKDKP